MEKLWEVGFADDELTRFCSVETKEEARTKYIDANRTILDRIEEPGWEKRVWAVDISDRLI